MFLLIILASQTFYPQLANFLHRFIRHIRDIFQLWAALFCTVLKLFYNDEVKCSETCILQFMHHSVVHLNVYSEM